ncbi:Battenin [Aphelenchoides bicaudatus]|nr:Battenin [Aphelenchoides bicaudatus]
MIRVRSSLTGSTGNLVAFWFLGLFNNFAYVIMLSAAKDILEPNQSNTTTNATLACAVLLADIVPSLLIKIVSPFVFASIAYNVRHSIVLCLQALSFIVVASSAGPVMGLFGVVLASLGAGLGDITLLALSSHFHNNVITSWSSGTGGAGIIGALTYAFLTDRNLLNFSPQTALFCMLIVPLLFGLTFYGLLQTPLSVHKANPLRLSTYLIPTPLAGESSETASIYSNNSELRLLHDSDPSDEEETEDSSLPSKWELIKPLLPFMVPLCVVYFGEYFINQGLVELLVFDCAHGFNLSATAQYRWYQVLYQIGVFVSRSSVGIFLLKQKFLPVLATLQIVNAFGFAAETMHHSIDYIWIIFIWILYEGALGGLSYANTFKLLHKTVPKRRREFSMAFVSMADAVGIVFAGLLAIPTHNFICSHFFLH